MPKRGKQQTLEATLGRPRVRPMVKSPKKGKKTNQPTKQTLLTSPAMSSPPSRNTRSATVAKSSPLRAPPPSSMVHSSQVFGSARKSKKAAVVDPSSSSEEEMSDGEEEEAVKLPVNKKKRGISDEDDDDDKPLVTPTPKRRRPVVLEDSDDEPRASSPIKRRRLVRGNTASSPAKRQIEQSDSEEIVAPSSTARASRAGRKPMTKKEKAMELLRRKRAGEVINEEEEESSDEDEEPARAMYDTDSDLPALNEFDDDEEGIPDSKAVKKKGKGKSKDSKKQQKKKTSDDAGSDDENLDDFIDDDSDAALGVPQEAYLDIPLEFTVHSHKPLKEHFRDAIEWLVQFKLDPGSADRDHALYRLAWKKLDAEVHGLATSKFASSAWRKDFYMALRARPFITSQDLRGGGMAALGRSCEACGRTGHPATYSVSFSGDPYYKDASNLTRFLQPVELDSDSSDNNNEEDEDEDGNPIPKTTREWLVGSVCHSNAETAHSLIHWKHELMNWVDVRLHEDGLMTPAALAERAHIKPKKRSKLVDEVLERWVSRGIIKTLYHEFKSTMESARNKPTSGRYLR